MENCRGAGSKRVVEVVDVQVVQGLVPRIYFVLFAFLAERRAHVFLRMNGAGMCWSIHFKQIFLIPCKNTRFAHKFFLKYFFISKHLFNLKLPQKVVPWVEVFWDPVMLHLDREHLAFLGDVEEPLV